jgi:hypothetical protein
MERQKQTYLMSIKKDIQAIELNIKKLKSNTLDFEEQVTVYQECLTLINALNLSLQKIKTGIQ